MSSGDDCTGTDRPACPSAAPVPVGWERKVEEGSVCYVSPSGTVLTSLEQTCAYLLADGTCKCGLECPLNMHKVFNFDPGVAVAGRGAPGAQGQQDMTKLCNHRRKTAAMATLYRNMEGAPGPCRSGTGPGLSLLFSEEGHLAVAPSTGVPLPSTVGSLPRVPLGAKTLEATSAPTGTWLIAPPFLQPHDILPGANNSPKSPPPASPCFGLRLPPPDAASPPTSPVVPSAEGTWSQRPAGRTSSWAGATGESPELGGQGPGLLATTSAPQAGKGDSPVSDALTSQSSHNPPVPLDAVPEGRGLLGLPPVSAPFPASSLLSLAAKAQLGSPDPAVAPSTLPPCPLPPGTLLALLGEQALGRGARWPRHPHPQDPAAHRVSPEPKGVHPPVTGQPLGALLSLLGAQGCPGGGGLGEPTLPPAPLPPTNGSPCPGTGLLPTGRDFSGQLLGLFGQLAASSDPTSGTSPWSKATGRNGGPGLLLGTLPLSVALGQHPPACGGDPEGPSLPCLLAASLLLLPLGIPLPTPDLLPSPGTLLSTLPPLPPGPRERGPEPPAPGPEGCAVLPDQPLLFSVLSTSLALHPTLLAAGLGPPEPAPTAPPSRLASPSVAPTSTGAPPVTTEDLLGPCPGSSLLGATPLGNRPVLSPLLPNQPLLPPCLSPLGLSLGLGRGPPPGTASPPASPLRSLQGNSLRPRPPCRGWRRKASTPRLSTRLETLQRGALSTSPGASPTAGLAVARRPWPRSPVKNRRRKLLT